MNDVSVLRAQPGDVIVIHCPVPMSSEAEKNLQRKIKKLLPDNKCIVLDVGMSVSVISRNT